MASKNLELYLVGKDLSASKAVKGLGAQLDKTAVSGSKMGTALKTGLAVGAGAAVALGVSAVHMAMQFQDAQVRLESAVKNVGGSFDQLKPKVDDLDGKMAKLGFTGTEVESSLAGLVTATKDPTKAITLMGLAADIARGRNIDLATATNILVKVETGHVALLGRLGIATKDATGKTISQDEAVRRLTTLYGGDAQASANTFAGKMRALKAESEDLAVKLGNALIPVVNALVTVLLDTVGVVSSVVHWFKQNAAAAAALGAVIAAALMPKMIALATAAYKFVTINVFNALVLAADGALELAGAATAADAAMVPLIASVALIAVPLYFAVRSFEATSAAMKRGKESADAFADSLNVQATSSDNVVQAQARIAAELERLSANSFDATTGTLDQIAAEKGYVDVIAHGGNAVKQYQEHLRELAKRYNDLTPVVQAVTANERRLSVQYGITIPQVDALAAANKIDLSGSYEDVHAAVAAAMGQVTRSHHPMSQAEADIKKVGDKSIAAADQVKALKDAFDELVGKSVDAHEATVTFYNDLATLTEKLKASKGSMDLNTQAGRDASSAFSQLAHDTGDVSAAQKDANYSTATMKKTLDTEIAALEKVAGNSSYARSEIAKLKHEEDLLYPAVRNVNTALSQVPNNPYAGVHIPSTGGVGGTGKFSATGGLVTGPGTKTSDSVLMHLSSGEFVLQASAVDKLGVPYLRALNAGASPLRTAGIAAAGITTTRGGGDVHIHLHGVMAGSEQQLLRWVDRGLKRMSGKGYATNN